MVQAKNSNFWRAYGQNIEPSSSNFGVEIESTRGELRSSEKFRVPSLFG